MLFRTTFNASNSPLRVLFALGAWSLTSQAAPELAGGNGQATISDAAARAYAALGVANAAADHVSPLADRRKELVQAIDGERKEFKALATAAIAAEKEQQRLLTMKNKDADAANAFARAEYGYDEAAKSAEALDRSTVELRKLEVLLVELVSQAKAAADDAAAAKDQSTAAEKDATAADRATWKPALDQVKQDAQGAKKAEAAAEMHAGLGSPDAYGAGKDKRDASDLSLKADLEKAKADRERAFAAVHATRAPGCNLQRVDFKNRDYEGMSQSGKPMPIRNGQLADAALDTFGYPWGLDHVAFVHLGQDKWEQAVVALFNGNSEVPVATALVFDLGSSCTVRYRGSANGFLSPASTSDHAYTKRPRSIAQGGGPVGCIPSEVSLKNGTVVQHDLATPPPGVCD